MRLPRAADSQWKQDVIERWLNTPGIPSDAHEGLLEMLRVVKGETETGDSETSHDTFYDCRNRYED